MNSGHPRRHHLHRWLHACLAVASLLVALLPPGTRAEAGLPLEDAVRDGRIMADIVGQDSHGKYDQPNVNLLVTNLTSDDLVLQVRLGLILASVSVGYADLVVGREIGITVGAGNAIRVPVCAFSLDPSLRLPSPNASYRAQLVTTDVELLALLSKVGEAAIEGHMASQIAVWMEVGNLTFEQVEDRLEIGLRQFFTETMSLRGPGPVVSPEVGTTPVTDTPPTGGPGTTPAPETPGFDPGDLWLPGLGALGVVGVALALASRRFRRPQVPITQPGPLAGRAGSKLPTLPSTAVPEEASADRAYCTVCNRPAADCICGDRQRAGVVRVTDRDYLEILAGQRAGQTLRCPDADGAIVSSRTLPLTVIGRPKISAPHALLSLVPPLGIKDLNSSNGTFVDGAQCPGLGADRGAQYLRVHDGSRIRLGPVELRLEIESKQAFLVDPEGRKYPVAFGDRTVLSRDAFGYIEIDDRSVSSPHLLLRKNKDGAGYHVRDLNSTNGSGVADPGEGSNYTPLHAGDSRKLILDGQRLRLGSVEIKLHAISQAAGANNTIQRIGDYVVLGKLGVGGMATVLMARDPNNRLVAIKVPLDRYAYDLSFRERFKDEAENMTRVVHPNVVEVIAVDEDCSPGRFVKNMGLQYIVMAYIDGCTLLDILHNLKQRGEFLPTPVVVELARAVAGALGAAHEQEIIHRDVKPSNFLIRHDGHVFLSDFGIARAMAASPLTRGHERIGAAWYMSPEYAANKTADYRSDIYSLGVVLYEMLVGRVPFNDGRPSDAVLVSHIQDQPPPPWELRPDVDQDLAAMALKCLSKAPVDRFQQVSDLIAALPPAPGAKAELARLVKECCASRETD